METIDGRLFFERWILLCPNRRKTILRERVRSTRREERIMSYYITMKAKTGFLLGGFTKTQSSRFESRRDAFDWGSTVRDANREDNRDVDPNFVIHSSILPFEIPRPSYYPKG